MLNGTYYQNVQTLNTISFINSKINAYYTTSINEIQANSRKMKNIE